MKILLGQVPDWLVKIGADPGDDDEIRLRKSMLVVGSFPFAFVGLVMIGGFMQSQIDVSTNLSPGVVIFLFVLNLLGVVSLIFLMVFYFVIQKNLFQEKSENLLSSILPKETTRILKNETRTIADHFEGAGHINFQSITSSCVTVDRGTQCSTQLCPVSLLSTSWCD
jgi:hypothetical protein